MAVFVFGIHYIILQILTDVSEDLTASVIRLNRTCDRGRECYV
jgi:hypothetical protein